MTSGQAPGESLLVGLAGLQIQHGPAGLLGLRQRGRLDQFARAPDVVAEVEQPDVGAAQEGEHAALPNQGQEGAPEDQAVETGQNGSDERAVTRYESFHGVVLGQGVVFSTTYLPGERRRSQAWVAGVSPRYVGRVGVLRQIGAGCPRCNLLRVDPRARD